MPIQTSSVFAEKVRQRLGTEPQFGVVLYTNLDWNIDDGFDTNIPASDFDNDGNFFEIVTMSSISFKALEGEKANGGGKVTVTLDDSDGKLNARRNYSIVGIGRYTAQLIMYYDKDLAFAEIGTNPSGDDAEHFIILFGGSPMLPLTWNDSLSQVSFDIISNTSTALRTNTFDLWTDSDTIETGYAYPGYYNIWANIDMPICFGVPVNKSWTKKLTNSKVGTCQTDYKPITADELNELGQKASGAMSELLANYYEGPVTSYGSFTLEFTAYYVTAFSPLPKPFFAYINRGDITGIEGGSGGLPDFVAYFNALAARAGDKFDLLKAYARECLRMWIAVEGPGGWADIARLHIGGNTYHSGSIQSIIHSSLNDILAGRYEDAADTITGTFQREGITWWQGNYQSNIFAAELTDYGNSLAVRDSLASQIIGFNLTQLDIRLNEQEPVVKSGDYSETSYIRNELDTIDITELYVGKYKLTGSFDPTVDGTGVFTFNITSSESTGGEFTGDELKSNTLAYNASYPYDIYVMDRYTEASYPSSVIEAYAYRSVKGVRSLTQIPNGMVVANTLKLADESGSDNLAYALYVNRWRLDATEEGWEDDIFVDINGSKGKLYDSTSTPMLLAGIAYIKCLNVDSWNALIDVYPKDVTGYTISSIANYDELYQDLAFQARVGLWTRSNSNLKFKYLSKEPEYDYFKDQTEPITISYDTLIRGSAIFTSTEQEDVLTDQRFEWRDNGIQEDPNQIIIKQNQFIDTSITEPMNLPTNIEDYDLWAIDNEIIAKKTSVFWAIRKGYPWRMVRCSMPLTYLEIDLYDTVKVDLPELQTQSEDAQSWADGVSDSDPWKPWATEIADLYSGPIKGVIHNVDIDAENRKIDLLIWLPILVGTNQKWGLAWPS